MQFLESLIADSAHLWLIGTLLNGLLVAIAARDRRHALRRRRYGAETGPLRPLPLLGLLFLLVGGITVAAVLWGGRAANQAAWRLGPLGVAALILVLIIGQAAILGHDIGRRRRRRARTRTSHFP